MQNIRLEIEYEGTDYCGWQIQSRNKDKPSIQETLEKALQNILQEKIKVIGSGRTDSGVHALAQTANFKTKSNIRLTDLWKALNSILPASIAINMISKAKDNFCACRMARSKIYRYIILNGERPSAFWDRFSWRIAYRLDIGLIRKEARALLGRHDFKSFCASGASAKDTIRTIKNIRIKIARYISLPPKKAKAQAGNRDLITIDIEADGFLYNMARNIVGTLVDTGRGRFKKGDLKKILASRDRRRAGENAPARGLFLLEVKY